MIPGILTLGYWALLYHTSWAFVVSALSIIYFGINLIGHLISVGIGLIGLCCAGAVTLITCPACATSPLDIVILILTFMFVAFVLTIQLGTSAWGLFLSIDLLKSGGDTCPINTVNCEVLVILFFLSLFFMGLRSRSYESTSTNKSFTKVDEIVQSGVTTKTTVVTHKGFTTTTIEKTADGVTTATTTTEPVDNNVHSLKPKAIITSLLLAPKGSLQSQAVKSSATDGMELSPMQP
ncbi:hypothetical protein FO519_003761 [Halicephalobus sp. NKZ332]|nr:hypothetical protein FO519_003761 [Halicephalobus sp. NKZ332]